MAAPTNGEPAFQIAFSGVIAETIRQLQRRASRQGRGEEFLLALRAVVDRLHHDPNEFGEPLYRLPVLRTGVRCAVIRPLSIDFAVCEDRPLVFIKAVRLLAAPE
ncbi:MAG: hypothetical protein ACYC3I_26065 [Gemmataceae bacterium]